MQSSLALFDRIFEYLDLPVDIRSARSHRPAARERARRRCLDSVSFAYEPDRPVLQGVSFAAEPGSKVAIVGETGSGKTTLVYLIARLFDVSEGACCRPHGRARSQLRSLRRIVGVVSQDTYLFHGTVREDLRFAWPDETDEQLEHAAQAARIHDHLASLPDGYDTIVGERGYLFSGGEKERLAIARAILRDPAVLVLDEATSALESRPSASCSRRWTAWSRAARHRDRPSPLDDPRLGPDPRARPTTAASPSAARRSCSHWTAAMRCSSSDVAIAV